MDKKLHPEKFAKLEELSKKLNDLAEESKREIKEKKETVKNSDTELKRQREVVNEAVKELERKNHTVRETQADLLKTVENNSDKLKVLVAQIEKIRNGGKLFRRQKSDDVDE